MALVNQQAAANGQPPIGFANPALYAIGKSTNYHSCFHDITTGNNFNSATGSPSKYHARRPVMTSAPAGARSLA